MLRLTIIASLMATFLSAQQFQLNITGQYTKENVEIVIDLAVDEEGKLVAGQKIDYQDPQSKIKSLKIVTANGLKGTLVDEREIVVYYKTSLNVQGLKIRNLYKVAHARVYDGENNINITFDKDHYQNIVSYLRYHNVGNETIKDLDNLYGSWTELEIKNSDDKKEVEKTETSEITTLN